MPAFWAGIHLACIPINDLMMHPHEKQFAIDRLSMQNVLC